LASTILACGRLIAPGTWPFAYKSGLRASSRTKSWRSWLIDSNTSRQSVSYSKALPKRVAAWSLGAAGTADTGETMMTLLDM